MSANPFTTAAEYIRQHGWYQGDMVGADGSACAMGAIGLATRYLDAAGEVRDGATGSDDWMRAISLAEKLLPEGVPLQSISLFNDNPATSEEDVLLLLKRGAERWEGQA